MSRLKGERIPPQLVLGWEPVDHPAPEVLATLIQEVAAVGGPAGAEVLLQMKLAHGVSFTRAIQSPQRVALAGGGRR
jgi:hypothetical protein